MATTEQLRNRALVYGYRIVEGRNTETQDDRRGRYYVQRLHDDYPPRLGPGYATVRQALESLTFLVPRTE